MAWRQGALTYFVVVEQLNQECWYCLTHWDLGLHFLHYSTSLYFTLPVPHFASVHFTLLPLTYSLTSLGTYFLDYVFAYLLRGLACLNLAAFACILLIDYVHHPRCKASCSLQSQSFNVANLQRKFAQQMFWHSKNIAIFLSKCFDIAKT